MGRVLVPTPLGWSVAKCGGGEWIAFKPRYERGRIVDLTLPHAQDGGIMTWDRRYKAVADLTMFEVYAENERLRAELERLTSGQQAAIGVS